MDTVNLTHNFLIAMPGMVDPNFNGTLTYICDHSDQGALGVVVNRPSDLDLSTLFEQIGLSLPERLHHNTVYFGGPVQTERGFVLHTPPLTFSSTLTVNDAVSLTTSKDVLEAVSQGAGPEKFMVSLGYAGWSAGQLEDEIKKNACPPRCGCSASTSPACPKKPGTLELCRHSRHGAGLRPGAEAHRRRLGRTVDRGGASAHRHTGRLHRCAARRHRQTDSRMAAGAAGAGTAHPRRR